MASWIDALASRSGPLLNAATHFAAKYGVEDDPPAGSQGLRWLAELAARFTGGASEEDERRFVEGAGAYFGLILIDHFAGASHRAHEGMHRVRLGRHGYFDPFAGIARAMQGDDLPRALLQEVLLAEAEAQSRGPLSRVVAEVGRQLEAAHGIVMVDHFDHKLWIEARGACIEIELTRMVEVTRDESQHTLESAVRRLVAAFDPKVGGDTEAWESVRERLYPRLVGPAFVARLPRDQADLHLLRLTSEVWVTLVLSYRERARYVRQGEVDTWSKDGAAPRAQALHNLARSSEHARFLQHETAHGPLVIAASRDGLDASRLLLPGLARLLARELGAPFVVAVPHRDTLLAASAREPRVLALLKERAGEAAARAPHAISPSLLLVHDDGEIGDFAAEDREAERLSV